MNKYKLLLIFLLTLVTSTSHAKEMIDKSFYLNFFSGLSNSERVGEDFPLTNARNPKILGAAIGYKFNDHFFTDLSIENRNNFRVNYLDIDEKDSSYKYEYKMKVNSFSSMLNLYYNTTAINRLTPYIVAGIGASYNKVFNASFSTITEHGSSITTISNGHKINLASKIGLGIKYNLSPSFDCGLQYHYTNLGTFKTGQIITYQNGDSEYETPKKGKLKARELIFNIFYKF